jgi:hypothetical protein
VSIFKSLKEFENMKETRIDSEVNLTKKVAKLIQESKIFLQTNEFDNSKYEKWKTEVKNIIYGYSHIYPVLRITLDEEPESFSRIVIILKVIYFLM